MPRTKYTIRDFAGPGNDVSTSDRDIADHWSRKGKTVTAVTTA